MNGTNLKSPFAQAWTPLNEFETPSHHPTTVPPHNIGPASEAQYLSSQHDGLLRDAMLAPELWGRPSVDGVTREESPMYNFPEPHDNLSFSDPYNPYGLGDYPDT